MLLHVGQAACCRMQTDRVVSSCNRCQMPRDDVREKDFSNNIDHEFSNLNTAGGDRNGGRQGA
jgi:hypothetical protein